MLRNLETRTYVALGLSFILLTVLLVAYLLGFVRHEGDAVRQGRAVLAEAIAANGSGLIARDDLERLRTTLRLVVDRNETLQSAAVRRDDGRLAVSVGDHDRHWRDDAEHLSTDAFVKVPIWNAGQRWGRLELRFTPQSRLGAFAVLGDPRVHLLGFIIVAGFFSFRYYLGRVLQHLDPSQAVPPHVRSALDTLAEGLLVVDKKENVVLANAAFAAIVGKTPEQLIGHRASQIGFTDAGGEAISAGDSPWAAALAAGMPQRNADLGLVDSDGVRRTFIVNCSPVLGSGGEHAGVLISLDDVTELEQNKVELRASKDAAEAANRAKSDFLANMSHEIRTPMNAILGFTDALRRGYDTSSADREKYLNTIHSSGQHLLQLINDVLDLSKVEAGRLEVERLEVPAHVLVGEVVNVFQARAEEQGLRLAFEIDGALPAVIHTDPTRLRQIATNLVGNAIKFTEQGGVTVRLAYDTSGEEPVYCLRVIDTGVGIPEDKLEGVFEAFVQADVSVTRRFGGTGLGLAISRRFARLLGGDIVARSRPGEGTEFIVTLDPGPLTEVALLTPEEALAARSEDAAGDGLTWAFPPDTRVLVVDDGEENRELVRIVLENVGLETACAENGLQAVEMVAAHRFDAVLMDMQMPIMDGYTATERLRDAGAELPIVALTADAMKGFEEKCLAAGCSSFLTKPVDIDALLALLGGLLDGTRVAVAPGSSQAAPAPAGPDADGAAIVSRLAGAGEAIGRTIARFVDGLPARFAQAQADLEAGDADALAGFGHWLKGAGGTVGFDAFTTPAAELEAQAKAGDLTAVGHALAGLEALAARLERPQAAGAGAHDRPQAAAAAPAAPVVSPAAVPAAVTADTPVVSSLPLGNPRMRRTVESFVERLGSRLDELEAALNAGDAGRVGALAGWLKGAAATVGLEPFTAPATALESAANQADEQAMRAHLEAISALFARIELPAADGGVGDGQENAGAAAMVMDQR